LDETGIHLSMCRRFGRSKSGCRVVGHAPKNWGDSVTLIAAIGLQGVVAPLMLRGSLTLDVFEQYLVDSLFKQLQPGDIVVMDNLSAHKGMAIQQAAKQAGIRIVYLPPYSYDFNPIELAWSKTKAILRTKGARTWQALIDAVAEALRNITSSDIAGWMKHCGWSGSLN
jgi:transposase